MEIESEHASANASANVEALTFFLPHDEYRKRTRHALIKDRDSLKKTREKNIADDLDVTDIDHKLILLNGEKGGIPGLIQIFSTQYELMAEADSKRKSDPDQMTLDDAVAVENYRRENDQDVWAESVPKPRPKAGDRVLGLDDRGILIVTDALGFREGVDGYDDYAGVFEAFVIPISRVDGYTADDKIKVGLLQSTTPSAEGEDWNQVTMPIDVDSMREAVKLGVADGESSAEFQEALSKLTPSERARYDELVAGESTRLPDPNGPGANWDGETKTAVQTDTEGPNVSSADGNGASNERASGKHPARKHAAAGNLAGAVKKVTHKATGKAKTGRR